MKAVVYERYGGPEELRVEEVERPEPGPGEARLAVCAASLNGSDAEFLTGRPLYARIVGLRRPRVPTLGSDVAGVVDAVGPGVTSVAVGDRVFADLFERWGCLAEHVVAPAEELVPIPAALGFVEAAALPQAGVIALQAVRDLFTVQPGQTGLILGAGGGVGTFALQLAIDAGASVTAVDHPSKRALLERLGAARFVDYTREDPAALDAHFDFILDTPGRASVWRLLDRLAPGGRYAIVGGLLRHVIGAPLLSPLARLRGRRCGLLMWDKNTRDLAAIADAVVAGRCAPAIDGPYPLEEAREAFARLTGGVAQGKVVVTVGG